MSFQYQKQISEYTKMYIKNFNLPIIPCSGKKPLLGDWPNKKLKDHYEIQQYLEKDKNITIGLVLGQVSHIIGVDIDGDEALIRYKELSGGELQSTWTFKTPSGGMRLLFSIPEGIDVKKYDIQFEGKHSALEFLGDGQQTIMPPSVLEGVGSYSWLEEKSPETCEIASAPEFIQELMTKRSKVDIQSNMTYIDEVINKLSSRCPVFNDDLIQQRNFGVPETRWFYWSSLLTKSGFPDAAKRFSEMSEKHDERSEKRIRSLQENNEACLIKCATFGCSPEQIAKCHNKIKTKTGDANDITNSPGWLIMDNTKASDTSNISTANYESIGLYTNKEGRLAYINGNQFAEHILEKLILKYSNEGHFYLFENGIYRVLEENDCSRILRDLLHQYYPDSWTVLFESIYVAALKRAATKTDKMNADKGYINLQNGIFLLDKFELVSHSPDYLTTIRIPITYDPNADCPRFKQFLNEIFEEDTERSKVTQEVIGYCMTPETRAQKAFILYGEGSNGKSVLLNTIVKLLGKNNVSTVPFDELNNSFARYDLLNKTVNIVTETEIVGKGFNSQYFKAIVAGDPIRLEIKCGPSFTYSPICKILIALNNLFYSSDRSYGFMRRLVIIPFNRIFRKDEADKFLEEKLEEELPGIFNFAVEGLKRLRNNNYEFTTCKSIDEVLVDYKKSINPFESFAEETIEQDDILSKVSYSQISELYAEWREENGYVNNNRPSNIALAAALKKFLVQKGIQHGTTKSNGIRYITGIKFKDNSASETEEEAAENNELFN